MLETEEVDVDYFTPSSSTSLSKIFGSSSKEDDLSDKSSLKYNAPLPTQIVTKAEKPKQTQYLFAGIVNAYEWINHLYEFRGKVGFTILKTPTYKRMVIYDSNKDKLSNYSNKNILSCLTIANELPLDIKVNPNNTISYYDDLKKFWSVNPLTHNKSEILDVLRSLNTSLEYVPAVEETENCDKDKITVKKIIEDETESDTDSSLNRKTKDSILKRMATMGQSVLPPPCAPETQKSDSSDTNESLIRQKPSFKQKVTNKKKFMDKKMPDVDKICELNAGKNSKKSESLQETHKHIFNHIGDQALPINSIKHPTDFAGAASSSALYISEEIVSNSDLRMNVNKMMDKLDILLDEVKGLDIVNKSCNSINCRNESKFQNEIIQKLLHEYEKKINKYEEFIKLKGFVCDNFETLSQNNSAYESFKNTAVEGRKLQQLCTEKDKEIVRLKEELQQLSDKEAQFQTYEKKLLNEIDNLKSDLSVTNIHTANVKLGEPNSETIDITSKLKQIMNDTFQGISVMFEDEGNYTGSTVKNIVGLVVKKTTIEYLKEF